jgi:hypothetical protein
MRVKITPALLSDLRQKAGAYDSKEWVVDDQNVMAGFGYNKEIVAETTGKPDAEYIAAASPAVVLALVAEIERLRDKLDALECPNCGHPPKFCMCDVAPLSGSEIDFVTKGEIE